MYTENYYKQEILGMKRLFEWIKTKLNIRSVKRRADKAIDKILTAQVILAEIQGEHWQEDEILFWCNQVESCMHMVSEISEHVA